MAKADSDTKRLDALRKAKEEFKQKQTFIRSALSKKNIQLLNNKIVFSCSDDEADNADSTTEVQTSQKLALFDDDDDNDDASGELCIKNQFVGVEGQKLLKLQSRFAGDKRFVLDERFLENEPEQESENHQTPPEADEKEQQLEILKSVIGEPTLRKPNSKPPLRKVIKYDPTLEDHQKFERQKQAKAPKAQVKKEQALEAVKEKETVVSKEKFFKVPENFAQSLKVKKEKFSLLQMFGKAEKNTDVGDAETAEQASRPIPKRLKHLEPTKNPFRYDSSDSEEDDIAPKQIIAPFKKPVLVEPFFKPAIPKSSASATGPLKPVANKKSNIRQMCLQKMKRLKRAWDRKKIGRRGKRKQRAK